MIFLQKKAFTAPWYPGIPSRTDMIQKRNYHPCGNSKCYTGLLTFFPPFGVFIKNSLDTLSYFYIIGFIQIGE